MIQVFVVLEEPAFVGLGEAAESVLGEPATIVGVKDTVVVGDAAAIVGVQDVVIVGKADLLKLWRDTTDHMKQ